MNRLTFLAGFIALLLISSPAWAGGESGLYIGGSLGSAALDVSFNQSGTAVNYDDDDLGYKIFVGYNFGLVPLVDLAIEGSYIDFGSAEGTVSGSSAKTEITGLDLFGLAGFNMGPLSLFGKVGAIYWDSKLPSGSAGVDDSSSDPAYGIGLQFQLLSISVRAEYEIFDLDVADVDFTSLGVSYTF